MPRAPASSASPPRSPDAESVDIDLTGAGFGAGVGAGADDGTDPDRQAAYAEWVERMRDKRESKLRSVRGDEEPARRSTYWSEEAVYEESRRLEEEPGRAVKTRRELLAVLGLGSEATDSEVQRQYRRLAKEHHPDRFWDADEATRDEQAERMQRISAAYRALQRA